MTFKTSRLDISTTENTPKVLVDQKLLDILFKPFTPSNLEGIKETLKSYIDHAESFDEMKQTIEENLYLINIATKYQSLKEKEETVFQC